MNNMTAAKRSSQYAIISLILLIIAIGLTICEVNASYEIQVAPDITYRVIAYVVRIILPVSFVYALMSVSAKKNNLGSVVCILSGLGTLMVILNLINSVYQA
ncbi:hypothetical protein [Pedobacter lusitanus]|uniref:hypothetical protein n=1 Tax=Pedobacter lusitanus TaxID=1503925 RepID=UPI0032AEDF68